MHAHVLTLSHVTVFKIINHDCRHESNKIEVTFFVTSSGKYREISLSS